MTLPVAETFGPTIQGEGPATGRRAHFLRLGGCNLSCSWCDTPYTWDGQRYDLRQEFHPYTGDELAATVTSDLVVLTGGEPLMHQANPEFGRLLDALDERGRVVHVETNGTKPPTGHTLARVELFAVSPKLDHAGGHRGRQDPTPADSWPTLAHKAILKVVCRNDSDVEQAAALATSWGYRPDRVWIMPEGTTPDQINATARAIADPALARGFNLSTRLHVLLWGNERNR